VRADRPFHTRRTKTRLVAYVNLHLGVVRAMSNEAMLLHACECRNPSGNRAFSLDIFPPDIPPPDGFPPLKPEGRTFPPTLLKLAYVAHQMSAVYQA